MNTSSSASPSTVSPVVFPHDPGHEQSITELLALIDEHEHFLVVAHTNPDGDAVGSTLAMGLLLEKMGKRVTFYNRDPMPFNFRFLPAASRWVTCLPDDLDVDVIVVLDCAQLHRVGEHFPGAKFGAKIVVVDHHKTWDDDFAAVYVRDVGAAATGEVIYRILVRAGVELDHEIAQCLYCCVLTDTGSFRYSSTTPTTFQIASALLGAGISPWEMTSQIYESQPLERLQLLGRSLATLERGAQGKLASIRLEREMFRDVLGDDFEQTDFTSFTDGFINHARGVEGVEVAAQLFEEAAPDTWRVSFRSRGSVDVSQLAARFGGGGNHNAAGCTLHGSAAEVHEQLSRGLEQLLSGKGE